MKHTYLKIYNQAEQVVGLPAPSAEEIAAANTQAQALVNQARMMIGELADGNPNGQNYVTNNPFWKFPFNCAQDSDPWLYPISAENGLFFTNLTGPNFDAEDTPCGPGAELLG